MKIILATTNKGKIKELQALLPHHEVLTIQEILGDCDVEEDGATFKANAIKKATTIAQTLKKSDSLGEYIVLADDSGLSVPLLGGEPGIYSARYAGEKASDNENINKLIQKLTTLGINETPAFYTAAIAIVYKDQIYTTHGWLHGSVIDTIKGDGGFGYDPIFVPEGYVDTLGVLEDQLKKKISHRTKALQLAQKIIAVITK